MPFMEPNKAHTRIFATDYSTAWTASLEASNQNRNLVFNHNREQGWIETNWIENTEQRHFLDVFTSEDFFLRSRYRMKIYLYDGKKNGQPSVLVRVLKELQIEKTFLGGWEQVKSSGTEEAVLLYRIGRLIAISDYIEKQKMDALKDAEPEDL